MKFLKTLFLSLLITLSILSFQMIYSQDEDVLSDEDIEGLFDDFNTDQSADTNTNGNNVTSDIGFELSLLGEHTFEFHLPVTGDEFNFDSYLKSPKFRNDLGVEIYFKNLKVISHWELDIVANKWGEWEKFAEFLPLENYISWSPWKFKLSAGFQNFTWGVADKINPTDNINPRDYRVGIESKKIPVLSLLLAFYPVDFLSIEAVYVPFEQDDKFPVDFAEKLEDKTDCSDVDTENIDFDPKSFILGGKVNFHVRNFDFSFSYLYDLDKYYTPVIEVEKVSLPLSDYDFYKLDSIDLVRKREHKFGADFKTTVSRFGLWLEFCYSMTEDYLMNNYHLRNHRISWVAGFDFNYGPNDKFYFNMQYMGELIPFYDNSFYKDYSKSDLGPFKAAIGKDDVPFDTGKDEDYYEEYYYRAVLYGLGSSYEGFLQGITFNMEWPVLNDVLTPSIVVGYYLPLIYDYDREAKYGSLYINPELDISPIDSFHILFGADLFYAWHRVEDEDESGEYIFDINRDDKIGSYFDDSNIYLEIVYKWGFDFRK